MSAQDPIAAPQPYGPFAPAEDPIAAFAPPMPLLPRDPKTADGKISPSITIQIEGDKDRIRDIATFTLTDDVQQLADPWSCEIPNDDGRFNYLLDRMWYPVTIWVSDPRVQDGREILWLKGVIVDVDQEGGESGTVIRLSGYDKGWYLGSGAPLWKNLRGISWGRLAQLLVRPENNWNFAGIVGVNLSSRLRQGRTDAEVSATKKALIDNGLKEAQALVAAQAAATQASLPMPTRAQVAMDLASVIYQMIPVIQTEPGQDCGSLLIQYAKYIKALVGVSNEGHLQLFQPDYKQKPSYAFHNHRRSDERYLRNNVLPGWRHSRAGDQLYNVVECVVTRLSKDYNPQTDNPNEGKDIGRFRNTLTAGPPKAPPLRRQAFNDGEKWTLSQANERAKWKWQQNLYGSKTLTYPVQGISQPGSDGERRLYCAGTMAEVYDSYNQVERSMYVSRVQFNRGAHNTTSTITLKLPDLLGA